MVNTESILTSVKKLLGVAEEYTHFDADIIMYINSVFLALNQIGVGPEEGFSIVDASTEWSDYMDDGILLNTIKPYVYLKVRQLFDPPTSSSAAESMNNIIKEFEFRITIQVENKR